MLRQLETSSICGLVGSKAITRWSTPCKRARARARARAPARMFVCTHACTHARSHARRELSPDTPNAIRLAFRFEQKRISSEKKHTHTPINSLSHLRQQRVSFMPVRESPRETKAVEMKMVPARKEHEVQKGVLSNISEDPSIEEPEQAHADACVALLSAICSHTLALCVYVGTHVCAMYTRVRLILSGHC